MRYLSAAAIMPHYLSQFRRLVLVRESPVAFPAELKAEITFGPEDAFGVEGLRGQDRTTGKEGTSATIRWNGNEGIGEYQGDIIDRLQTAFRQCKVDGVWAGNVLYLKLPVDSIEVAEQTVNSTCHILPPFLSVRFRVFVWIKKYSVDLGGSLYDAELLRSYYHVTIATTEKNQSQADLAVSDWLQHRDPAIRLIMAMTYYRHAQKLAGIQPEAVSMAGEVVLNLAKAIEILFSSNRESVRSKAKEWGLDSAFIERWIIPILLTRNELDVAHVSSAPLTDEQHQVILLYVSRANEQVGELLCQMSDLYREGRITFPPLTESLDSQKRKLIERVTDYANSE